MTYSLPKGLLVTLCVGLLLSIAALTVFCSYRVLFSELSEAKTIIEIEPGTSLTGLIRKLNNNGIISDSKFASTTLQILGFQKKIKAGTYETKSGENLLNLMGRISRGEIKLYSFTIIEGTRFEQILETLRKEPNLESQDINSFEETKLLKLLRINQTSPEGLFFPDTYHYATGSSALLILRMSNHKMQKTLDAEWPKRNLNLPYTSKYEALILASIIEKESADSSEKTKISGVFSNRLRKKMRLQSDPTVIYGLGESYKGNIKKIHLRQKTPYNTYKIKGLPPTPIAMSGRESIRAALQPEETSALYFVSKGDGSHVFSSSLLEHNKAVEKYQKMKRNGKR